MFDINIFINLFNSLPPQLVVFLISVLPIFELRGAIPVGLTLYNLDIITTFTFAVLGNLVPMLFILTLIDPISKFLMKHFKFFDKLFNWLFIRTSIKFEGKFAKYGSLALILFVAIPLPVTGIWTGAVAAWLFQIPKKHAIPLLCIGVIIAGIIVTILTKSAILTYHIVQ